MPTVRGKIADYAYVLLLLVSRCSFAVGAAAGGIYWGLLGFGIGLAGGWIMGLWMRWSLGLRRRR
ncbi:MAG: hypothetical protein KIS67_17425 [Verrucomicrobiae bacterium]|nr:hypothetical protein [Verrucomicrobiae bacterium]